ADQPAERPPPDDGYRTAPDRPTDQGRRAVDRGARADPVGRTGARPRIPRGVSVRGPGIASAVASGAVADDRTRTRGTPHTRSGRKEMLRRTRARDADPSGRRTGRG